MFFQDYYASKPFTASFLFSFGFAWDTKVFFGSKCETERTILESEIRHLGGNRGANKLPAPSNVPITEESAFSF